MVLGLLFITTCLRSIYIHDQLEFLMIFLHNSISQYFLFTGKCNRLVSAERNLSGFRFVEIVLFQFKFNTNLGRNPFLVN